MRFRLRTLMIVLALGPPVLAFYLIHRHSLTTIGECAVVDAAVVLATVLFHFRDFTGGPT